MVGKVAVFKVGFKTGGIGTVPTVTTHDDAGKACISYLLYEQRYSIKEARIEYKVCTGSHCLRSLSGKVGISCSTFTGINNFNTCSFCIFNEGILQTVGIVIILCIDDSSLGYTLVYSKLCSHLALIRVDEAVTEYSRLVNGYGVVGSTCCQKKHTGFVCKLGHRKGYR